MKFLIVIVTILTAIFLMSLINHAYSETASWYDCAKPGQCSKSKITASGQKFNPNALTAAHRSLPFGTKVKVIHKGKSVIVVINDRGPFVSGVTIDLSRAAAAKIGCTKIGKCSVSIKVL